MGNNDGSDVGVCNPWIKETNAYGMDNDNSIRTRCCNVGYQIITVLVAENGPICSLSGPRVDEDEASAAGGVDVRCIVRKVPGKVGSILPGLSFYSVKWLLFP